MRTISRVVLCFSLVVTLAAFAQNSGPASNGDFQYALEGATGAIQYNARSFGSSAQGQVTFTGTADISDEDVDGEGTGGTGPVSTNVTLTVNIDCLRIQGNRAAMSGTISSSNISSYVGVRALLAVEDGGEGNKSTGPDKFTWGTYRANAMTWTPEDAEVPGDPGWSFSWLASDAERFDDVAVPSSHGGGTIDCQSFPFGSYAFEALPLGAGNIQVKP
ncbi:MAG TPA: hypothetical protein VHW00_11160 [Thermoanaerobaculia bacterium]|nr:hypothetical protein [Thermoanaerobaculia bacterium]